MERKSVMKKTLAIIVCCATLLSGCGTYTGEGVYVGASFGSMIGSAVGGISGGFRGSDVGSLVGMAGGAVVGGVVGTQADKARRKQVAEEQASFDQRYQRHRAAATRNSGQYAAGDYQYDDESGFDPTGSGDDTLYDFNSSDYTSDYSASRPNDVTTTVRYDAIVDQPSQSEFALEVRYARLVDDNQDHALNPNELCKLIFEVYNTSSSEVFDVQPMVVETTGNKQILISSGIHVESIAPGKGIRYTAMVKAGKRLKGDNAVFRVYAVQGKYRVVSNTLEFNVPIKKTK